MRRHKAQSMGFTGYTPGPNGDTSPTAGNQVNVVTEAAQVPTYLTGMIRSGMTIAAPTQQFTPSQQWFRSSLASGRWQADPATGAHAYVNKMEQDPLSGAVDVVRMEAVSEQNGCDYYADQGGQGGRDYGIRRPY